MSYQGPMLIREPEFRWPIVLLAALLTAVRADYRRVKTGLWMLAQMSLPFIPETTRLIVRV